ncbi:hypothetical protein YC2023_041989 [Brassica napus]
MGENKVDVLSRPRDIRNGSVISVSCCTTFATSSSSIQRLEEEKKVKLASLPRIQFLITEIVRKQKFSDELKGRQIQWNRITFSVYQNHSDPHMEVVVSLSGLIYIVVRIGGEHMEARRMKISSIAFQKGGGVEDRSDFDGFKKVMVG